MAIFEAIANENQVTIKIAGNFIFDDRKKFFASYANIPLIENKKVLVDLTNTKFLDSTALEMLLILRECCGGNANKITLKIGNNADVAKIIHVTNFEKIFNTA